MMLAGPGAGSGRGPGVCVPFSTTNASKLRGLFGGMAWIRVVAVVALLCLVPSSSALLDELFDSPEVQSVERMLGPNLLDTPVDYDMNSMSFVGVALAAVPDQVRPSLSLGVEDVHYAPVGLLGLPLPDGAVLRWHAPLVGSPISYVVYRAVDDAAPVAIAEVSEPRFLDSTAWQQDAMLLTYSVTARFSAGEGPSESPHSNRIVLPGPLDDCFLMWVDWSNEPLDWVQPRVNDEYLECVLSVARKSESDGA